jgi:hypothetical protein
VDTGTPEIAVMGVTTIAMMMMCGYITVFNVRSHIFLLQDMKGI